MGALRREMVTHGSRPVLGGETASLLDAPSAVPEGDGDPFSRAFETGAGGGGYTVIEERTGGGPEGERRSWAGEVLHPAHHLKYIIVVQSGSSLPVFVHTYIAAFDGRVTERQRAGE